MLRNFKNPLAKENGKYLSSIVERKDLFGFRNEKRYKYVGGKNAWNALVAGNAGADADNDGLDDPWLLIQDRKEFQKYIKVAGERM
mgnify:CR=1 FL=1